LPGSPREEIKACSTWPRNPFGQRAEILDGTLARMDEKKNSIKARERFVVRNIRPMDVGEGSRGGIHRTGIRARFQADSKLEVGLRDLRSQKVLSDSHVGGF